jgi:hypothetical protein
MPTNAINNAVATNSTYSTSNISQVASDVALPSISNLGANGNAYMQIISMRLGISGRSASRTVRLGVWNTADTPIGTTNAFTVEAAPNASLTAYQNLNPPLLIDRSSISTIRMGFWVSANGSVYFQSDDTSQTVDIEFDRDSSNAVTTFVPDPEFTFASASLVGDFNYYTVPSAPESISLTAGSSQVGVSWTPPADDGGTAITSYTLQRATNAGFTTGVVNTTGLTGLSTTVTGLTNGTPYFFRVYAVNAVGTAASTGGAWRTGGASVTPVASTAPGAPTSPVASQQTVQTSNGLKLSWTAPASNGGSAITQYAIQYSTEPDMVTSPVMTGSTATTYNINGLLSGATYYMRVAAVNAIGTGPYSDTVSDTTYTVATGSNGVIKRWDAGLSQWVVIV